MRVLLQAEIDPFPYITQYRPGMLDFGVVELPKNSIIIPDNIDVIGHKIYWSRRDSSITLLHKLETIPDNAFSDLTVDVLILPNTKNLTKIELGAFRGARVDKIVLSKDIDKSKLQVHAIDKEWLLKHIELA